MAHCWGTTATAADLQLSAFFDEDGGSPGEAIEVSERIFTPNGGPNNSHQYEFIMDPNAPRLNPYGRFDNDGITFYIHNSGGRSSLLPVELTGFTATYTNEAILLNWATASEINNDKFEVLKSQDAINFSLVGTVAGNGTTSEPQSYALWDNDAQPGLQYYRLRQVDYDGTSELSRIVSVLVPGSEGFRVGNLFPNPTRNMASLYIALPQSSPTEVRILNLDGKVVMNELHQLDEGNQRLDMNVSALPAGAYWLELRTNTDYVAQKLVIIH